jgi:hypothetical protein
METPPRKYFFRLAQKTGVSASAGTEKKLLHLLLNKAPFFDELYETSSIKIGFCERVPSYSARWRNI